MKFNIERIKEIELVPFSGPVYDIITNCQNRRWANFFANDIVVHNSEGTMGRRIQKGWREIPFKTENGKSIILSLQMETQTIDGLSGHSDRNQLISFVHHLAAKPDKVIICHGENQKAIELARSIHKLFRIETTVPRDLEAIRLK